MQPKAIIIFAVIFCVFIGLGIISKMMTAKIKDGLKVKAWQRFFHLFLTVGICGLAYLFFAFEGAALLGARFWLLAIFITTVVWFAFIAKYLFFKVPKLRKKIEHERNFKRYIP